MSLLASLTNLVVRCCTVSGAAWVAGHPVGDEQSRWPPQPHQRRPWSSSSQPVPLPACPSWGEAPTTAVTWFHRHPGVHKTEASPTPPPAQATTSLAAANHRPQIHMHLQTPHRWGKGERSRHRVAVFIARRPPSLPRCHRHLPTRHTCLLAQEPPSTVSTPALCTSSNKRPHASGALDNVAQRFHNNKLFALAQPRFRKRAGPGLPARLGMARVASHRPCP